MFGLGLQPRNAFARGAARRGAPGKARRQSTERYAKGGIEPAVEDLINDPVTEAIMAYDHITPASVRSLVAEMRAKLLARAPCRPAKPSE